MRFTTIILNLLLPSKRRYIDITSFLHGLVFQPEASRSIPSISAIYDGISLSQLIWNFMKLLSSF